jgi:hypothetical protein
MVNLSIISGKLFYSICYTKLYARLLLGAYNAPFLDLAGQTRCRLGLADSRAESVYYQRITIPVSFL